MLTPFQASSVIFLLPSPIRTPKPTPRLSVHLVNLYPIRLRDLNENALRDSVTAFNGDRRLREIVDLEQNLVAIAAVVLVNDANAMWNQQVSLAGRAAAECHHEHVPRRRFDDDIRRDKSDGLRGNRL